MRLGKQSIAFDNVYVGEAAVAAGPKENSDRWALTLTGVTTIFIAG